MKNPMIAFAKDVHFYFVLFIYLTLIIRVHKTFEVRYRAKTVMLLYSNHGIMVVRLKLRTVVI